MTHVNVPGKFEAASWNVWMALRMFGEVFPLPRKPDDPYLPMWAVGVIIGSGIIALMWLIAFLAIVSKCRI